MMTVGLSQPTWIRSHMRVVANKLVVVGLAAVEADGVLADEAACIGLHLTGAEVGKASLRILLVTLESKT